MVSSHREQIQNDYRAITMDQWMGFYRFCNEVLSIFFYISSSSMAILFNQMLFPSNVIHWFFFFFKHLQISFPDMTNYSLELAWPSILDNFFEWMREKQAWKFPYLSKCSSPYMLQEASNFHSHHQITSNLISVFLDDECFHIYILYSIDSSLALVFPAFSSLNFCLQCYFLVLNFLNRYCPKW